MSHPSKKNDFGLKSIAADFRLMLEYKELSVLNFAILVSMIGFGLIMPFLPIYAGDFGASDTEIGIMVGLFALMRLVFSPIGGWTADKIGRKPSMVVAMFMYTIVMYMFAIAGSLHELFLYRGLQGAASGLMWPVAMTYIGDVVKEEDRGKAMALFSLMFATGMTIGPVLGGVIATYIDIASAFYITSVLSLISAVLLFVRLEESHHVEKKISEKRLYPKLSEFRISNISNHPKNFIGITLGSFSTFFGIAVLFPMLPIYGKNELGLSHWEIGALFALMGLVQMIFMFPAGVVGDKIGKKNIILTGGFIAAIFSGAIAFTNSFLSLVIIVCIYTFGRSIARPMFPAIVASLTDKENRGKGMGIYTFAQNMAFALGATIGGYVSQLFGRQYPFIMSAIVGMLGVGIIYYFLTEEVRELGR